jgi:D-threonate/D-erythronate kinase
VVILSNHTVLIIADDLTGAADSTTAFARQGFRTRVIADASDWSLADIANYDVVAFNTETRNLPQSESTAIVVPLARQLAALNPRLILKKIDSTFRGQVLTETLAISVELGLKRTVITSAHPTQKRTVSKGSVFVDGIPLRDTSYARQPSPPPIDIPLAVREAFGDVLVFNGLSTSKLPENPPHGVYLPDVSQDEDLTRIARWIIAQGNSILPVGSAGLAHAFARFLVPPIRTRQKLQDSNVSDRKKLLIVIGSTQPEIGGQIQMLKSTRRDVVVADAANGKLSEEDIGLLDQDIIVVRISRGTNQITRSEAASNLAETTYQLMNKLPIAHLVTVGGDTSWSVLHRLGITGFDVSTQDLAGFPRGETTYNDHPLTYVAKPAGFSKSSIFALMAEVLLPR